MSPKALFVTTVPITLEAFLVPLARHFRARGWTVDALANGAGAHAAIDGEFDARHDVSWSRSPFSPGNLAGARVREVVAAGGYDLVHVHTPIAAYVTRAALHRMPADTRPAVVYTAHGFHFYRGGRPAANAAYRALERRAAAWTDALVTINAEDFEAARRFGTIDPERVRLVPGIGVDTDRYHPGAAPAGYAPALRESFGVSAGAFLVAMVAELAPVKRHAHLLDALARTREDVEVLLVGEGPLESRLRERAVALRVQSRVHFAGYRRDVPELLASCDALALVSEREGLARSVLEGMASGLPVIGTDTRGIADAITPETGWVAAKHDVAALAGALDAAAADREEAARRGVAGRARAIERYALPRIIDAYEELYRDVLA